MEEPGDWIALAAAEKIAMAIFGFLFITALLLLVTPYILVAGAIEKGAYGSTVARKYKKSIQVFEDFWKQIDGSRRQDEDD